MCLQRLCELFAGEIGTEEGGVAVRTEAILCRVAFACAFLMLLGPVADRTMWLTRRGFAEMIDAAAYNMAALLTGIVALGALAFADWARTRATFAMLLGVAGAIAAFGLTVFATGVFVLARWQGEVWFYGAWDYAEDPGKKQTIVPADGPYFFFVAAFAGAIATSGLAVIWLRQRRDAQPAAGGLPASAPSSVLR
jgi:hypothetical protein